MEREDEVEFLREALRRRVEQTSVRRVAREVSMSHGGVYNLITGKVIPYGKTLIKLRAWYLDRWAQDGEGLSPTAARYLLDQMLRGVPLALRPRAGVEVLNGLEAIHAKYGMTPPPWLPALRNELLEDLEAEEGRG